MNLLIPNLLGIAMSGWLGTGNVSAPRDAVYQCQDPQWTSGPTVTDGEFHGTLTVDCTFTGTGGDGYTGLQQFLIQQTTQTAQQINSGPTQETYDGLPSTAYGITTEMTSGSMSVTTTGTAHFATDGKQQLVLAFISSEVDGQGDAQYLKSISDSETVTNGASAEQFAVHSENSFVVEKPSFAPVGIFEKQVEQKIEDAVPDQEKQMINEVAPHI
jgi:hypothetical protein